MNARKAVLADNPELILRVLQLRFDESLSYPRISAQTEPPRVSWRVFYL